MVDNETIYLGLYTDGATISSNSTKNLWILGATILNLPLAIRSALKNFVQIFAFYGEGKPPWHIFVKHFARLLQKNVTIEEKTYKIQILQVNADLPAQQSLFNLKFGGYFPCVKCKVKGAREKNLITFKNYNNVRRTPEEYLAESTEALQTNSPVGPIVGLCSLRKFLTIPTCITVDYMHTFLGGPIKTNLIELFAAKKIADVADQIISLIVSSTLPSELRGRRISKTDQLGNFKATEWKLMMNYVFVVTFLEIFGNKSILGKDWTKKQKQFLNVLYGISGVMILCLDIISEEQLEYADKLVKFWFENRAELWSDNPWLPKAHMMTHFVEQVRQHGPLHKSSCFPGESLMGMAAKKVSSNKPEVILEQICRRTKQTSDVTEWAECNTYGQLKGILKFLLKTRNASDFSYEIPSDSEMAKKFEIDPLLGLRKAKIQGYEFEIDNEKKSRNSIAYYDNGLTVRPAVIQHIYMDKFENLWIQLKPLRIKLPFEIVPELTTELLRNKHFLTGYGQLIGEDRPIIVKSESIRRKGFIISSPTKNYVVPLLHVYEHN
uniref:Uncharacterized protein n=1 Tax=Panagrolaimus sp. JU765 TaxID=591449 RepID=A0AC34Q446_9BILA